MDSSIGGAVRAHGRVAIAFIARTRTLAIARHLTALMAAITAPFGAAAACLKPPDAYVNWTAPAANAVLNPAPQNVALTVTAGGYGFKEVTFFVNETTQIGVASPAVNGGSQSFTWNGVSGGTYTIKARARSTIAGCPTVYANSYRTFTVNSPPSVSLTQPASGVVNGPTANIYMSANASDDGSISKVEFYANGSLINTDTAAPFEFTWTGVGAGTYSILARAYDNHNTTSDSGASSVRVNALPTVAVTAPANPTNVSAVANFTVTSSASDADGTVTKVDYFINGSLAYTSTSAPNFPFAWNNVNTGSYALAPRATDNNGQENAGPTVTINVSNVLPTVTLSGPANNTVLPGPTNSIAMTATAGDTNGSVQRVEFYNGATLLHTDFGPGFSYTWSNVGVGTYSITAKAFDNEGAPTTSSAASVKINAQPTVSLASSPTAPVSVQAPGNVSLTATAADSDGGVTQVEFLVNDQVVATDSSPPYQHSLSNLGQGWYSVKARVTDTNNHQTTTSPISVTVTSPNSAQFISQSVPAVMTIGQTYPVTVTMKNTGTSTWTAANSYSLGSQNPQDNSNWGTARVATVGSVTPNNNVTYSFNVSPPATPGNHNFQWRMVRDGFEWFGDMSANVVVRANGLPTVSLSQPIAGAVYTAPAAVSVAATASDDSSVQRVEFRANGILKKTITSAPYSWTMDAPQAGTQQIVARAYDADGAYRDSTPVSINVQEVAPFTVPNTGAPHGGSLAGAVAVSPSGAATYSVPLSLPPGTAAMVPALSLEYSSQDGVGLLGVGWDVSGLSRIHRCAQTITHEGRRRGIELNSNDRYCLDGQRLILVPDSITGTPGTYGATAEYRTEVDTFAQVRSFGSDPAKGPDRWEVRTKAGLLMHFGNTADSLVEAQGKSPTVIHLWALARVQDRSGNYWSVTYDKTTSAGEHYPKQISYTGNTGAALTPYAAVRFVYATRPDAEVNYVAGAKISNLRRVTNIQTFINIAADGTGGTHVRDYRIGYTQSSQSGRSLVQTIQDAIPGCEGTPEGCIPATSFAWQHHADGERHFNAAGSGVWGGPTPIYEVVNEWPRKNVWNAIARVDLNGDGKMDMLKSFENGTWQACLSTGTSFDCQNWSGPAKKLREVLLGDFNGDGRADIIAAGTAGAPLQACLSTGTGFNCVAWPGFNSPQAVDWSQYLIGDHNGDGRDDLGFCYSTGSGFNCVPLTIFNWSNSIVQTNTICPEEQQFQRRHSAGDFNGDGRVDYLVIQTWAAACKPPWATHDYTWQLYITQDDGATVGWVPKGAAQGLPNVDLNTGHTSSNLGATNQDEYSDVVLGALTGNVLKICRSTGADSFVCDTPATDPAQLDYASTGVADFDGDGRADTMHYVSTNVARICQIGSGGSYVCSNWAAPTRPEVGNGIATLASDDFNGDGKTDFATYNENTQQWSVWLAGGARPDLMSQVTNGLGHVTQLTYKPLSDNTVYTRDTNAVYPKRDVQDATPVVSQVRSANGLGDWLTSNYKYGGLKSDLHGRGSLGFRWTEVTDQFTQITTRTEFEQDFPKTGMVKSEVTTRANGTQLSNTQNTIAELTGCPASGRLPYTSGTSVVTKDLNGAGIAQVTTTAQIDCYGNRTLASANTEAGAETAGAETYSTTTENTFDNVAASWRIGELRCSKVIKSAPGYSNVTRTTGTDYDALGRVSRDIVEPKSGTPICYTAETGNAYQVITEYTRDAFGNAKTRKLKWTENGTPLERTVEDITYEPKGRFPQVVKNALNHTETLAHSEAHGGLTSLTGPNGIATSWEFDGWGRKKKETRADTTFTTWAYRACQTGCAGAAIAHIVTPSSGVPSVTYLDALGRELRLQTWSFNGAELTTNWEYEAGGRLLRVSDRRPIAQAPVWTSFVHDELARVTSSTDANGITTVTYNGLEVTTVNANNQNRREIRNGLGKLRQVFDHNNKVVNYQYEPFGNLALTTDAKGNRVVMTYDRVGRKDSLTDPDLGYWTYSFNPLGELKQQVDPVRRALGQSTTFNYDTLGRITQRVEPDATSAWTYDSCTKGVGKLCQTTAANAYQRTLTYDILGRVASVSTNLDGTYITAYVYDANGRVANVTHTRAPLGGSSGPAQAFNYVYNPLGWLKQIQSGGGAVYWVVDNRDALDRVTRSTAGNGLVTYRSFNVSTKRIESILTAPADGAPLQNDTYPLYDAIGNLKRRMSLNASGGLVTEDLTYDPLNRLATSSVVGQATKSFAYDELGNLTTKTGVGTFNYPTSGASSVRPHAVSSITGTVNGITNPGFTYDANGNTLTGLGRTWTWTAANYPKDITQGSQVTSFTYGPDYQRVRQTVTSGATTVRTIHYAGTMEKEIVGSTTIVRTYLPGGLGVVVETTTGGSTTTQTRYFHSDRQGSLSVISSEAGAVLERLSYDPWGRRRNVDGTDPSGSLSSAIDRTGYTAHEMLDDLGLVHMNGRVYDPLLARMKSADPTVPEPNDLQGFNRYSYAGNNSMNYTDPSGFSRRRTHWLKAYINGGPHGLGAMANSPMGIIDLWRTEPPVNAGPSGDDTGRISDLIADGLTFDEQGKQTKSDSPSPAVHRWSHVVTGRRLTPHDIWAQKRGYRDYAEYKFMISGAVQPIYPVEETLLGAGAAGALVKVGSVGFRQLLTQGAKETGESIATTEAAVVVNSIRGRASEARVLADLGLVKNTKAVSTAEGRSFPDALTTALSVEVKDSAIVTLTRQLRIQTEAAREAGRESVLVTGQHTCVSAACSRAFDTIIRRSDLGPPAPVR